MLTEQQFVIDRLAKQEFVALLPLCSQQKDKTFRVISTCYQKKTHFTEANAQVMIGCFCVDRHS